MRALILSLVAIWSSAALAAAPIEPAPEKPAVRKAAKQVNLDEMEVQGSGAKAAIIIIPRDSAAKRAVDSTNDHLLDAIQRR